MNAIVSGASPLAALASAQRGLPGGSGWDAWRAAALARLVAQGLPTPRDDAWKYTNLRLLGRRELAPAAPRPVPGDALDALPALVGPRLVFVDGHFRPALSTDTLPPGVGFTALAELLGHESPATLAERLAAPVDAVDERIRLLNGALFADGARILVAHEAKPALPLNLVYLTSGGAAYPRLVLDLGAAASITLVEWHVSSGAADSFVAAAADLRLGDGANLEHYSVQLAGNRAVLLDDARVEVGRDARYAHRHVALGAQLARLDLRVRLAGRGASADLAGLILADGTRQLDVRTRVDHATGHTTSDQVYRGVATGRGRGSYDGKVIVHAGAAKSKSHQSNRNLLLSPQATIDSRPQLEINTDDVMCGHAATTGALDEQMLFYLLSRGLDLDTARALLTFAFAEDVVMLLRLPALRRFVEERVLGSLPAAALIREFVA
jgi:Fe-S cluster assembly protein SufD